MKNITQSILAVVAVLLLFAVSSSHARAEFYLRPVVQFSKFSDEFADADPAVGGGLALGAAFGRNHSFEVGAEVTNTNYSGTYQEPTAWSTVWGPDWTSTRTVTARKEVPATFQVTPILVTFRYSFVTQNEKVRPFLAVASGINLVSLTKLNMREDNFSFTAGLGGGVSYKLGDRTRIGLSYRYVFSGEAFDLEDLSFKYNAHTVTLALDLRF